MELKKRKKHNVCPEYKLCLNNGTEECRRDCSNNFSCKIGLVDYYCTRKNQLKYIKGYED